VKYPVRRVFKCKIDGKIYRPGDEYPTRDKKRAEFLQKGGFIGRPAKPAPPVKLPEVKESVEEPDVSEVPKPRHIGGGTYELPDGRKVKGREAAYAEMEGE